MNDAPSMDRVRAIREVIPDANTSCSKRGDDTVWQVNVETTITLAQLRQVEALIGHDAINLVPADYDGGYSEYTPGDGLIAGYLEFVWNP
jgi:hypothetical protein